MIALIGSLWPISASHAQGSEHSMVAINVKYPWARLLCMGLKLVEVREVPLSTGNYKYIEPNKPVLVVETPPKPSDKDKERVCVYGTRTYEAVEYSKMVVGCCVLARANLSYRTRFG